MSKKKQIKLEVPETPDVDKISREKIEIGMFDKVSDGAIYDQAIEGEAIGFFKDAWLRFKKNKSSVVAGVIILFIIFMAIFLPSSLQNT